MVLLLAGVFYMWTAYTAVPFTFGNQNATVYAQLTSAFQHGHTYLRISPPAGLLHLQNRYDPAQNAPYQAAFHDLPLRNGHFYSPWGPTPAVTLYLAARLVGLHISDTFAAALFSFVGLICAVALLHLLARRFVPKTPTWLLIVATAGIALTNVAPFILRRPAVYEVAISAGYCFAMAGILLTLAAVLRAVGSSPTAGSRQPLSWACRRRTTDACGYRRRGGGGSDLLDSTAG